MTEKNDLISKVVKIKRLAVWAAHDRPRYSIWSYCYEKCSDSGDITCTVGWVVIWLELGGLKGIGGWGVVDRAGMAFFGTGRESGVRPPVLPRYAWGGVDASRVGCNYLWRAIVDDVSFGFGFS